MLKSKVHKLRTYYRLGVLNLLWVLAYRLALRLGFFARRMPIESPVSGQFFVPTTNAEDSSLDDLSLRAFGWIDFPKDRMPSWQASIFSKQSTSDTEQKHWSQISDFDLIIGDIKGVWELSRFDWALHFAVEYRKNAYSDSLDLLNCWLADWSASNPANSGVNWKCGQEASIRVMHLCLVAYLLQQHRSISDPLALLLEQHLRRISPTVLYAMAQDNNHGTSEAVALFVGGLLLEQKYKTKGAQEFRPANKWKKQGRFWIENRLKKLILQDGSFSQHSVNYHRLMLDTMSLAEIFRIELGEMSFSSLALERLAAATHWLSIFVDPVSGDVPNIGANDGARIIPLTNTDYRDYRPSVRLASALFLNRGVFRDHAPSHQIFTLLRLPEPTLPNQFPERRVFDDGGYLFASNTSARIFLKYPRYRFRPSQCDALHLDVWLGCRNILRDAGTYSYNTEPVWMDYFPGTAAHNTVQFDEREQMPRFSRFLYGDWLSSLKVFIRKASTSETDFVVAYKNLLGHFHQRNVVLTDQSLRVEDKVDGFNDKAVIRWRLIPGQYALQGNTILGEFFQLSVEATSEIKRFEIVTGWESRYYFQKTKTPVLEVEISKAAVVTTKIVWGQG